MGSCNITLFLLWWCICTTTLEVHRNNGSPFTHCHWVGMAHIAVLLWRVTLRLPIADYVKTLSRVRWRAFLQQRNLTVGSPCKASMSLNPLTCCRLQPPQGKHMVLLKNMTDADYHVTQQPPSLPVSLCPCTCVRACLCTVHRGVARDTPQTLAYKLLFILKVYQFINLTYFQRHFLTNTQLLSFCKNIQKNYCITVFFFYILFLKHGKI